MKMLGTLPPILGESKHTLNLIHTIPDERTPKKKKLFHCLVLFCPQQYHIIGSILSLIKEVLLLINLFKC